jgi:hypothetical protein
MMSRIHVCFICHTEGFPNSFEVGVPTMLRIRDEVEQSTGKPVRLTWALGTFRATGQPPIFDEYRDLFLGLLERGDEIGLHPHGIVRNGRWDVDPFIVEDTEALCAAGFPSPRTFVAGVWAFYPSTLAILEERGYGVDASVVAGLTRQRQVDNDGNVLYDYPPSEAIVDSDPFFVPYRLSRESVVRPGLSNIIEVPVAGHLEDMRPSGDATAIIQYNKRRERLASTGLEVHEIFWHPWELLEDFGSRNVEPHTEKTLKEFLLRVAPDTAVHFSTVYEAAMDWAANSGA